jgi:hypothetical protein
LIYGVGRETVPITTPRRQPAIGTVNGVWNCFTD